MFNYLKTEIFRTFKRKGYWVFLCMGVFLLLFSVIGAKIQEHTLKVFEKGIFYEIWLTILALMSPIFAIVIMIFSRKPKGVQYSLFSGGLTKSTLFFGDFIVAFFLMVFTFLVWFLLSLGMADGFFQDGFSYIDVLTYSYFLILVFFQSLTMITCVMCFGLLFRKSIATSLYFMLMYVLPILINSIVKSDIFTWLHFIKNIHPFIVLTELVTDMSSLSEHLKWNNIFFSYCIAFSLFGAFLLIGIWVYKKKEI